MFILAVDVGYSNLKIMWGHSGQTPTQLILPAGAGPKSAMPEQLGRGRDDQHVDVMVDGEPWVAGVEPSRLQNWERELHSDYPDTSAYLALFHAAMVRAGAKQIDRLVTGLPVSQYLDDSVVNKLRAKLIGTHRVADNLEVNVKVVDILAQPSGAYLDIKTSQPDAADFDNARTLVIDPGFFSFDWVLVDGGELRDTNSGSSANAMSLLLEGADNLVQDQHQGRLGRDQLEKLVRSGAKRTQLFGSPIDLSPIIAMAAKRTAPVALTAVKQSLRSELRQVDVVLLAGGGADVYAEATRAAFPKARLVKSDNPVMANVRGFWAHADMIEPPTPQAPAPEPAAELVYEPTREGHDAHEHQNHN